MKRFSGLFLFSLVAMGLVTACDSKEIVTPQVTSTTQETDLSRVGGWSPLVFVLVVDDAATTEAAQLRARAAAIVRDGMLSMREQIWRGSCGNPDPAAWHAGDMRVLLARPSAPDSESLLTPLEIPALAWTAKYSTEEEGIDLIVSAMTEALEKRLAGAGETYRPLRAAKRALDLVNGARPPENDGEAALVASLPADRLPRLLLASSRDDNDAASIESLVPAPSSPAPDWNVVVGPFEAKNEQCDADGKSKTRLEAWGNQDHAYLAAWPCYTDPTLKGLLSFSSADCAPACHDHELPVATDGTTDCRVFVDQENLDLCEPERGHRDPDGKAQLIEYNGMKLRRCEVNQLTGDALQACRSSLACSGCQNGFCATEVPELTHPQYCEEGKHEWPLRFIGESISDPRYLVTVVCNVVSTGH